LKEILNPNLNFFHIHPGYLPDIRGADGSLNSILYSNSIGVTSFLMTDKNNIQNIIKNDSILLKKVKYIEKRIDKINNL